MAPWLLLLVAATALLLPLPSPKRETIRPTSQVAYSDFLKAIDLGHVSEVEVGMDDISFRLRDDKRRYQTQQLNAPPDLIKHMSSKGIRFSHKDDLAGLELSQLAGPFLYGIAGLGLWLLHKQETGSGNVGVLADQTHLDTSISFDDIAGIDASKAEVMEVVDIMKNPQKYLKVGARIPAGILLCGPPGTGKTLLARAIAAEAKVPFIFCSGSDFVEMFVGRGAARVRELFERAKRVAPSIIFIDELDALGKSRGRGYSSHDEAEQTLNQLLACMDGIDSKGGSGVVCVAATNRFDVLDEALCRPGRFDRVIKVGIPDARGRRGVFRVHTRNMPLASDVNLQQLAEATERMSPAEIAAICNEAAISAAREGREQVSASDFWNGLERYRASRSPGSDGSSTILDEQAKYQNWQEVVGRMIDEIRGGKEN